MTESGDYVKTNYIRSCLEFWTCDFASVDRALVHCVYSRHIESLCFYIKCKWELNTSSITINSDAAQQYSRQWLIRKCYGSGKVAPAPSRTAKSSSGCETTQPCAGRLPWRCSRIWEERSCQMTRTLGHWVPRGSFYTGNLGQERFTPHQ